MKKSKVMELIQGVKNELKNELKNYIDSKLDNYVKDYMYRKLRDDVFSNLSDIVNTKNDVDVMKLQIENLAERIIHLEYKNVGIDM